MKCRSAILTKMASKRKQLQTRYLKILESNAKQVHPRDLMSHQWVQMMIERIESAKQIVDTEGDSKLHPIVKEAMEKYKVIKFTLSNGRNIKMLMLKKTDSENGGKIVPLGETFPIMRNVHKSTNHGGIEAMAKWLSNSGIVVSHVCLLSMVQSCDECIKNMTEQRENEKKCQLSVDLITKTRLNEEKSYEPVGLINIIDMSVNESTENKLDFLLIYQDELTKFLQLRPLSSAHLYDSVSNELTHLFSDLGPPECLIVPPELAKMLGEVVNNRLNELFNSKISIKVNEVILSTVSSKVKSVLSDWVDSNVESRWCIGCFFVQWELNNICDENGKSPFERVFGKSSKANTSHLVSIKQEKPEPVEKEVIDDYISNNPTLDMPAELGMEIDLNGLSIYEN